jgi:hypothetical protein
MEEKEGNEALWHNNIYIYFLSKRKENKKNLLP